MEKGKCRTKSDEEMKIPIFWVSDLKNGKHGLIYN